MPGYIQGITKTAFLTWAFMNILYSPSMLNKNNFLDCFFEERSDEDLLNIVSKIL